MKGNIITVNLRNAWLMLAMCLLVLTLYAGQAPAAGQEEEREGVVKEQPRELRGAEVRGAQRASELIGKTAKGFEGDDLGSINDLVVSEDGRVSYLILSKGGVLGIGGDLVPIPWDAANARVNEDAVIIDVAKNKLDNAPSFKNNEWPNFTELGWRQKVHGYYGTSPESGVEPGIIEKERKSTMPESGFEGERRTAPEPEHGGTMR